MLQAPDAPVLDHPTVVPSETFTVAAAGYTHWPPTTATGNVAPHFHDAWLRLHPEPGVGAGPRDGIT